MTPERLDEIASSYENADDSSDPSGWIGGIGSTLGGFGSTISRWAGLFLTQPPEAIPAAAFVGTNRLPSPTRLSASASRRAVTANQRTLAGAGVSEVELTWVLGRYLDLDRLTPGVAGPLSSEAVAEAIHQFQQKCYVSGRDHDGIAGERTLDDLGLRLDRAQPRRVRVNSRPRARQVLRTADTTIASANGYGVTGATWWQDMTNGSFLGFPFTNGVHRELIRALRKAEAALLTTQRFRAMTPVQMARHFAIQEAHKGFRPTKSNRSMHVFGLAFDLKYFRNPWVRGPKITRVLDAALGNKRSLPVPWASRITTTLQSLGESGATTREIHAELMRWNALFVAYLQRHSGRVRSLRGEPVFVSGRDPARGFLDLDADLVVALRDEACLAWGAVDFGPNASGDMMHFDTRTFGPGGAIAAAPGGTRPYLPRGHRC